MGTASNTSRIAKNTLLLYFRQILIMLVSLYTVRVVLNVLGAEDYGIYNVVAGVVTMFSFLTSTMASASQRYLAVDLTTGDLNKQKQTFGLILLTYILLMVIIVILAESIAVWFLNAKMTIPDERIYAANWVLQAAILMFVVNILATPYLSAVIAHEKMNIYAYVSIADAALKLAVVFIIKVISCDKLILYAFLLLASSVLTTLLYITYCRKVFPECKAHLFYEKQQMKEMTAFAWWNMIGSLAHMLRSQGINVLLNLFFNPMINAARAIAYQINNALTSFSNNFYTAVKPQIIKSYATGELDRMIKLITSSSRVAFFLVYLMTLPLFLNMDFILKLWLINPPEYANLFAKLVLINALLEVFNMPLVAGLQATGNIKMYQIIVSGINLLNMPISYVLLKIGFPPETTLIVNILLVAISLIPRLLICKKYYDINIKEFVANVIVRVFIVATLCFTIGYYLLKIFDEIDTLKIAIFTLTLAVFVIPIIYFLGFTKIEQTFIKNKLSDIVHKCSRK